MVSEEGKNNVFSINSRLLNREVVRSDTSEYDDDFTKQTDCEVMTVWLMI